MTLVFVVVVLGFCFCFVLFFKTGSLCSPGYPGTDYVE